MNVEIHALRGEFRGLKLEFERVSVAAQPLRGGVEGLRVEVERVNSELDRVRLDVECVGQHDHWLL